MRIALALVVMLWTSISAAHPKHLGKIVGTDVDLITINHSFSGSIKERIVLGFKKQGQFVSELQVVENDLKSSSEFRQNGEEFGGELKLLQNNSLIKKKIKFVELMRSENKYVMEFAGQRVDVFVDAEKFENGHFYNPRFSMQWNGEEHSFKMESGQACYGYSLHLITMIMPLLVF